MSIHTQHTPNSTRHVGTCGDKRVAIIIQDPQATHEVHVVDTDALPDPYHQNLMDMIMRPEAQASKWLGEFLHRQMFFDGTNSLRRLYEMGWITQVPVTSVYLTPRPNQRISLAEELGIVVDPTNVTVPQEQFNPLTKTHVNTQPATTDQYDAIVQQEQTKLDGGTYNQHIENLRSDVTENNRLVAANLLAEADMLDADARNKRTMAEQYDSNISTPPVQVSEEHVDTETGKVYASAGALKGAQTRRSNAAKKAGTG